MKNIRLLPRHEIYLRAWGYCEDARFARVFRQAWPRIPLHARRAILNHWRSRCSYGQAECPSPNIEVLDTWSGATDDDTFLTMGQCSNGGHELRFLSRAVDLMPDDILAVIILHELSHVYGHAIGRSYSDIEAAEEIDVETLECFWGIDQEPAHEWMEANDAILDNRDEQLAA